MAQFKVRARTVDMLGRQQIAGIPTAISELFKNAHDAYADRVEVDYYRTNGLFVLRDDGLGMTQEDFEQRWLMLGTESKLDTGVGMGAPPKDEEKAERRILGEKGIGRLAIASIGPQVLLLSRSKRGAHRGDLVAAFIHWGLFEVPGLDLDKVEIPVMTYPGGKLPSSDDIQQLVGVVRSNIQSLNRFISASLASTLEQDLKKFDVDPQLLDSYLKAPSLAASGHGTQFYIKPAYPNLSTDIEEGAEARASRLEKVLIGFTNTMTPNAPTPPISAEFRYHKSSDLCESLIGPSEFFTPEEFAEADHHIEGEFDEYGNFSGTVAVYSEQPSPYVVAWKDARGRPTECGPFRFHLAIMQGLPSDTKLPPEDYARINAKLDRIAGIYIYRDGIRVLPYGDADVDFLEIEKRRTKSASYYYFSHRNLFGIIETSRQRNGNLCEKAGREGFIENTAYLQFRKILMNFLVQVAADYFRAGGAFADSFVTTRQDLKSKARRNRKGKVSEKTRVLTTDLKRFFDRVQKGTPASEVEQLLNRYTSEFQAAAQIRDHDRAVAAFLDVERRARGDIASLGGSYRIIKPQGVALPPKMNQNWRAYETEAARLRDAVFDPASAKLDSIATEIMHSSSLEIDRRIRFQMAIEDVSAGASQLMMSERRQTADVFRKAKQKVEDLIRESRSGLETAIQAVGAEFSRLSFSDAPDERVVDISVALQDRIRKSLEQNQAILAKVRAELQSVLEIRLEDGLAVGATDETEALEEDLIALQEQRDLDLQLVQLGMAIEVISHEFQNSIRVIRDNLRRLKVWADLNPGLNDVYEGLRNSFTHLDGYLTLFTPLHRRLYREQVEIAGTEIRKYLEDLFVDKLLGSNITIEASRQFLSAKIFGYPSTFYPVFINLVDNAVFWLRDHAEPRTIRLDADGDAILVSDNGPGIPTRDRESVFQMGFTRKPGGRGLGLYISRDVLGRVGYRLSLGEPVLGNGATFRIEPKEDTTQLGDDELAS